jgi:hypothetical protein
MAVLINAGLAALNVAIALVPGNSLAALNWGVAVFCAVLAIATAAHR